MFSFLANEIIKTHSTTIITDQVGPGLLKVYDYNSFKHNY